MQQAIHYWQVPIPEWDFPLRITYRTNKPEDIHTADWSLHWHEQLEFQLIRRGGVRLTCSNKVDWVYAGDLFFADWCQPHHATAFLEDTEYYVFQVELSWLLNERNDMRLARFRDALMIRAHDFDCYIRRDEQLNAVFLQILDVYEKKPFGYELEIKGLFLRVLTLLFRNYFRTSPTAHEFDIYDDSMQYTRSVLNHIAHHFNEAITLEQLSEKAGISKNYLSALFKKHTGCTVVKCINRMRCYRAISLIEGGMSVTQVAQEVGYSDYNYFSRIFKKTIGISPTTSMRKIDEDLKL